VTEMVKPEQLTQKCPSLHGALVLTEGEHPAAAQIAAREPEPAVVAGLHLRSLGYDVIDLNFGCPLRKECGRGRGAAMMREPELVARLVSRLVAELDCPITVKLRAGWSDEAPTAPLIARAAVDAGAAMVCVHGRSKEGWYRGSNDLSIIARVKAEISSVPVIANGDIDGPESALRAVRETGADGVMIGRAAVGNPWVFEAIDGAFRGEPPRPRPSLEERLSVFEEHADGLARSFARKTAQRLARKYAFYYFSALLDTERREQLGKIRDDAALRAFVRGLSEREAVTSSLVVGPGRWNG